MQTTPAMPMRSALHARRTYGAAWQASGHAAHDTRRATERTGSVFVGAALCSLLAIVFAASLLAHAAVADAPWAWVAGSGLLALVACTQLIVRHWVVQVLGRAHREAGLTPALAQRRARMTLRRWTR